MTPKPSRSPTVSRDLRCKLFIYRRKPTMEHWAGKHRNLLDSGATERYCRKKANHGVARESKGNL